MDNLPLSFASGCLGFLQFRQSILETSSPGLPCQFHHLYSLLELGSSSDVVEYQNRSNDLRFRAMFL